MPASSEMRCRPGAIKLCSRSKIARDLGPGIGIATCGILVAIVWLERFLSMGRPCAPGFTETAIRLGLSCSGDHVKYLFQDQWTTALRLRIVGLASRFASDELAERLEQIDRQREDRRRIVLGGDLGERLQI